MGRCHYLSFQSLFRAHQSHFVLHQPIESRAIRIVGCISTPLVEVYSSYSRFYRVSTIHWVHEGTSGIVVSNALSRRFSR